MKSQLIHGQKRQNLGISFNTVKTAKSGYFFPSHLFTFHSVVQLLLPTVKLNGFSQPISLEYKMVHGLNQAVFIIKSFKNLSNLAVVQFTAMFYSYVLEQVSDVTLSENNWI